VCIAGIEWVEFVRNAKIPFAGMEIAGSVVVERG
jgi:hypothetical protein